MKRTFRFNYPTISSTIDIKSNSKFYMTNLLVKWRTTTLWWLRPMNKVMMHNIKNISDEL